MHPRGNPRRGFRIDHAVVLGEFYRQPGLTEAMPTFNLKLPPPFEEAVKTMEREIMPCLMRSTGDRDDAMDLFQETWLRAYRAYPTLQSEDGLRPWIFRIASNLCRNRVRDRMRRMRVITNASTNGVENALCDSASSSTRGGPEAALHLKRSIARLP